MHGAFASLAVLATLSSPAGAELVRHTYTGVVDYVSDGSSGTVDLTGTFSIGQSVTIGTTVELSTPGILNGGQMLYINAVIDFDFSIGSYTGSNGPSTGTFLNVANDFPLLPPEVIDGYSGSMNPDSPGIGPAVPRVFRFELIDYDATVFSNTELPRTVPDLSNFETANWALEFEVDSPPSNGSVLGTLRDVSTPADPSTWGRIKASYRN